MTDNDLFDYILSKDIEYFMTAEEFLNASFFAEKRRNQIYRMLEKMDHPTE